MFYTLPFKFEPYSTNRVEDANGNFIFQFNSYVDSEFNEKVLKLINEENPEPIGAPESIIVNGVHICLGSRDQDYEIREIIIRGWGNLTGTGANNFSNEKAIGIQNELRDFIISKLCKLEAPTLHNIHHKQPLENKCYIGRGSQWGNPFVIKGLVTRDIAIQQHKEWLEKNPSLTQNLHHLSGKELVCYCTPKPCHGDTLISLFKQRYLQ
jgi:hypothetical protein